MLIYEQRKQSIDMENKQRRNPTFVPAEVSLPVGGRPKNKQLNGLAGTPMKPQEEIPEHQKGAFFKQKMAHQKNSEMFDGGTNMIEQVAAQLGQAVQRGEMPRALAEKKLKQAIDDMAKDSRGVQMAKKRKEAMESERNQENKMKLMAKGQELSSQILAARGGDKEAQSYLRDIKFDWTKPQADAVLQMGKAQEQKPSAEEVAVATEQAKEEANMPEEGM